MRNASLAEDDVGKLSASFKGEFLGKNEGVIAVEEKVRDLES